MNSPTNNIGVLAKMPPELHYLIEPVLQCGCRTEWDAFAFLDNATKEEMNKLAQVAERVLRGNHYPLVNLFLDEYQMTKHEECARLYFFFGLLDHGGLKFDS